MTSRDNQEVRHCVADRQARSGLPKWKNEATRPAAVSSSATPAGLQDEGAAGVDIGYACEVGAEQRQEQALAAPISVVSKMTE
jgi:hypothetical protein